MQRKKQVHVLLLRIKAKRREQEQVTQPEYKEAKKKQIIIPISIRQ